ARLLPLPSPEGAREAEGGDDVGRRAADAGDGARADGATEAALAGRAVDGPGAGARRAHLRDGRGDQQAGHDDPAGRAERELRAGRLEARLRARDRNDLAQRRLRRVAREPRGSEGVPGRMSIVIATLGVKALYLTYA